MKTIARRIIKGLAGLLMLAGLVSLLLLGAAFTTYPWRMYRWLAVVPADFQGEPDYIIMLGGGGVPSESGLVRTYHAAAMARHYTNATVIVALPYDEPYEGSAAMLVVKELVMRGVTEERILLEPRGRNTRQQALNMIQLLGPSATKARCLLVTSPDHMKRGILSLRKAGFAQLRAEGAFAEEINAEMAYHAPDLDDHAAASLVPDAGRWMLIRYDFWNNLGYENAFFRELTALIYYRLRGWI